jgi:isoleucyl-tRNA synthetase
VAAQLAEYGRVTLCVDGTPVLLDQSMISITDKQTTGWQLCADGAWSVALDLTMDDELRRAGLAREFVRLVNDRRKQAGLPSPIA